MKEKKEVKVVAPKKATAPKSTVELVQYTIKAVIPTGAYANIQPEIVVKAKSLQEAEEFVIPHINKLFEDFLNKSERRTIVPKVEVKETPAPAQTIHGTIMPSGVSESPKPTVESTKVTVDGEPTGMVVIEKTDPQKTNEDISRLRNMSNEPLHTKPYEKAKTAIENCYNQGALDVIKGQIVKSQTLTETEKTSLLNVTVVVQEKKIKE
jgi:hypothetical protein